MGKKEMVYQTALGIETGDWLSSPWSPKPKEIRGIGQPSYVHIDHWGNVFVRDFPTLHVWGESDCSQGGNTWCVHGIIRHPEKGYLSHGKPITIQKPATKPAHQIDMFKSYLDDFVDTPYQFQNGVDYETVDPWRCPQCELDFNAPAYDWNPYNTACPQCGESTNCHVFVMAKSAASEYVVRINHATRVIWR